MKSNRCSGDVHFYIRTKGTNGFIFKCRRCPHYTPAKFAIGRKAKCPYCTNEFTMDNRSIKLVNPHCGCRNIVKIGKIASAGDKTKKDKEKEELEVKESFLDDLVRKL